MSGYTDEDIKKRIGNAEPFEYLIKPVESIVVKNAIDLVLQKKNDN